MRTISRRFFLSAAGVLPFAQYFEKYIAGTPIRVRCEASSNEGKLMLGKYARAVASMKKLDDGDPTGWLFQWYTHAVRPDKTKSSELQRIYNNPTDLRRSLASDVWNTCEPHFRNPTLPYTPYFLPWHRMFVYFFEQIISQVLQDDSFALPYWNYSASGSAHGVMPAEFRMPSDPIFGSLYVGKRNKPTPTDPNAPDVNAGEAIDKSEPGALDLGVLAECGYLQRGDAVSGFNKGLDQFLHGNVHVEVGGSQNMGAVPWAAGDPVFWMHHSNVDRLWASWNAAGRTNPTQATFLDQQFVFADRNGHRIVSKVGDFLDVAALGYRYDNLESVPPCHGSGFGLAPSAPVTLASSAVATPLGNGPVTVKLRTAFELVPFEAQMKSLPSNRQLYLLFKNLEAKIQPGVLYRVYLNLPSDQLESKAHLAGYINFFDAVRVEGHEMGSGGFVSLGVTDVVKSLAAGGFLRQGVAVTISPSRQPVPEANASVAEIRLVQQE